MESALDSRGNSMSSLLLLQITDTHLFADPAVEKNGVVPARSLHKVLDEALSQKCPNLLLASGDLAQEPVCDTYRAFVELVRERFEGPILAVPGNHDVGDVMQQVLSTDSISIEDWRIATLDTHIDHEVAGHVDPDNLHALSLELEECKEHVLIVGHHPITDIGCTWLDAHRVDNGEAVVHLLENCPASRGYLCGHIHQEYDRIHNGIRYMATPSTCWQFSPNTDSFGFDESPPGWRWLELHDNGDIHTEVCRLKAAWNERTRD